MSYRPSIYAYSAAKNGRERVSAHFRVKEFKCQDGSDTVFISPALVQVLEAVRGHFGRPIIINSGYRTPPYNKRIKGAKYSQHQYGTAADIVIRGVAPAEVARYARSIMPDHGGVGIYDTFTHIDVRSKRADWRG